MPELPEIETIRRGLAQQLVGRTITRIQVRETRLRLPLNRRRLHRWISKHRFAAFERRAKYLLCRMSNDATLVIHLGMSGRLAWCGGDTPLDKHDHVRFHLDADEELRFHDPRRFGLVETIAPGKLQNHQLFAHLGLEPFAAELTAESLFASTRGLARPVKNFLLDGTKIVGIGNIYASESLFRARIHPTKPVSQLRRQDWKRLLAAVRQTLKLAIASGGTTLNDFFDSNGEMGYFQQYLKVYDREGEKCKRCKTTVKRIVQVGRSTFFCPKCQKKTTAKT